MSSSKDGYIQRIFKRNKVKHETTLSTSTNNLTKIANSTTNNLTKESTESPLISFKKSGSSKAVDGILKTFLFEIVDFFPKSSRGYD